MNRMLLVLGTMMAMAGFANAQTDAPVIDQRQANQEQRIDQGIERGQLTQHEANRLEQEQTHIDNMEHRAKADGVLTNKERKRIGAAQNRASRHIFREKHDRQAKRSQ